jgi:hypothetical protein
LEKMSFFLLDQEEKKPMMTGISGGNRTRVLSWNYTWFFPPCTYAAHFSEEF